ncbi:unnamed protein product [Calypogeia fissa]
MKEPDLTLHGRASMSRSLSPVSNRDSLLSPSAAKARGIRESHKFSWDGYETAITKNEEEYKPGSISPPSDCPSRRPSRFSSPILSPMHSPSRGPSPDCGANPDPNSNSVTQPIQDVFPTPTTRRPSKRQSVQIATPTPIEINGRFSAPPDLYSFPRSKSHVRFSRSLPKLPDEFSSIQRFASPVDFQESVPVGPVGASPVLGFGHGHGRPSFLSHQPDRGRDGERRAFFGDNYGYGDVADSKVQQPEKPIKVTLTPRVPGDEAWRDDDEINHPKSPKERLDGEQLTFTIPEYLADLRGTSQEGERPVLGPRLSNIAGVQVMGSHRRSTFVRAVEAVTGLGATLLAPSVEKMTGKYVTTAAKKSSTVIIPVNAKQWLLQSLRMKDWELRELFDQMEMIPQLAGDHVREVRAEWESLEARAMKVPPEADLLLKDQQLLERTRTLLRRFVQVVSEDTIEEQQQQEQETKPPQETRDISMETTAMSEQEGIKSNELQPPPKQYGESVSPSPLGQRIGSFASPSPLGLRSDSLPDVYLRKPMIARPFCTSCGRLDTTAPNTRIMGGILPRESIYQSRGPSPIPRASLPSFIPYEDYVVRQSIVKPTGKSDQFKSTYSPLEKRWYTVLFPALQPGKREDVSLLGEWLCHATQKSGVEDPDGHFKDVETAFVLYSISFLEIVRQVRIHCEERGDMILHVWRQLLRIFNQVMQRAEPKLTSMEDEVRRVKELHAKDKVEYGQRIKAMEELRLILKETEDKLHRVEFEVVKYKRCRLCLAGNMTPRTRESFVKKAMLKRFSGTSFGIDGREKTRAELLQESVDEIMGEGGKGNKSDPTSQGKDTKQPVEKTQLTPFPATAQPGKVEEPPQAPEKSVQAEHPKSSTVITFLRAALLKRSQRPTVSEAATLQLLNEYNAFQQRPLPKPGVDRSIQTDEVTITEVSQFAKVLKRSASCPARLFWTEIHDPEKAARHKQWLIDNGMIADKHGASGDDDEVEIVVASSAGEEAQSEGAGEAGAAGDQKNINSKMKKHVNRLANETMDTLAQMGEDLGLEGEASSKVAALLKKWKKVARATSAFGMPPSSHEEGDDDGDEPFEWDDGNEGDGDDDSGVGRGRRRRKRKGSAKREGEVGGERQPSESRKSLFDIAADVLKRSKKSTGKYTMAQPVELGKTVPLGFAKMMDISKPPKVIKFFNDRQLTKLITAVYMAKVEADALDDAADSDRQSSCEFVYDFMLNLYGLKRLAESAVWGLFKKINQLRFKKEIEKCHKARIFNRFCGMDENMYYSERDLYLYLKVMSKGISTNGLFYPSELDDGISYVNCVWVESLAAEPNLIAYLGSQAAALDFIQKFVATHATFDKVSLEVKKITKSEKVKRVDFDELMEAIFEKGAIDSGVVSIPKKAKKGTPIKAPLTAEQRLALENLFVAGDANQDGVLTFQEFREIIKSANPTISHQNSLRIFRETLLLEPEGGDKITPAAFATVAHKHDISAPPPVIFDLLKKTWLQIQADVNENKIKDEAAKKESDELRMRVATLVDAGVDTNGAVQAFRDYVLKFCGEDQEQQEEEEEQEQDQEQEEEPEQEQQQEEDTIPEGEEEEEEEPPAEEGTS